MKRENIDHGLVHVYTGGGKGKTTAALGLALRAVGYGKKVLIIQFIKGFGKSGELIAARRLKPHLSIKRLGSGFVGISGDQKPLAIHRQAARRAFALAAGALAAKKHDLIILDEINVAISLGLLSAEEVAGLIKARPEGLELVLTGRGAPAKIINLADYVSEIREIKHPFRRGIGARKAIDY